MPPADDPPAAGDDLLGAGTLPAAWAAGWRAAPDRPALGDAGDGWRTNRELAELTATVASRLAAAGLGPGDRVVVSGPTGVDLAVVHLAALRAGLVVIPINPAITRAEFDSLLAEARPRAVLADGDLGRWAQQADPATPVATLAGCRAGAEPGPDRRAQPSAEPVALDQAAPSEVALLAFTSGTTGRPKGVALTHANLLAGAEALRRSWAWTPDDRLILALPLFHMHGMGVGLHGTLLAGASAILMARFDPQAVLTAAADPATTLFFGVPTMYSRLIEAPGLDRLGGLRLCVSGSAPLRADLHRRIHEATGQVVLERYGMTETVMLTSNPLHGERRPGTVGRPLPGVELRLDPDSDEIQVRGPNVFGGYLDRPEANATAFTDDGWFRTGDVGRLDPDGYLSIVGRAKDLIITGGYNVYPAEIEEVLRGHPGVRDAAVAGRPSAEWGEVVVAWVEVDAGFDAESATAWCAERLTPYKRPRQIHPVDALPRNALGKIQRDRLADP